ncbi:MAG: aspartate--tRNA(Asn) ligase [Clostridia bacterium]|nr:aspartate--tRNA(Asn) ligase [Clostridia bacterium]
MTSQISMLKEGRVCFQGMIDTIRDKKNFQFIVLRDFSGKIQLFIDKVKYPEIGEMFLRLVPGATVKVEGELVKSEYVKMGGQEVLIDKAELTSSAEPNPIAEDSTIDYKLDYRWLDLRTERNLLMFKVQTAFVSAMREFLVEKDFIEIHSPKLIATASESGAEVFQVKYFDTFAYLAQSPQFYKQMAMAGGLGRIFECGPVFRAEKSHSRKHTTEFTGFDLEFSNIESFEDVMKMEEELLTYALKVVKEKYGEQIKEEFGVEVVVPTLPFPRIKLADLYVELEKRYGYTVEDDEKDDLSTEAEKLCAQFSKEVFGHEFLFVTDFGARKRAFYHMRKDGIPQGYDLIWKGVEITTGAQREHRYDILKAQAEEKGLDKDVEFYLQFFKYGCPPHGGFGLGLDRITMNLLELSNIKEAMFLFRGPERITP